MWVVLGALVGIIAGVVFGERTSILPVGSAYAMMLQIAVYPYLLCALIYGLGRPPRWNLLDVLIGMVRR